MSDVELLHMAAKAAGSPVRLGLLGNTYCFWRTDGVLWNPLTGDADAFRLAVQLRMSVDCDDYANLVRVYTQAGAICFEETLSDCDPCAATRRAIVRAAASVGKDVP